MEYTSILVSATAPQTTGRDLLDDCVHCGFCLPTCPTYLLWGQETDSPRGRIHLMKLRRDGRDTASDSFVQHIDTCLGCMACVTACPSGVQYDSLLEAARPAGRARRQSGRSAIALFRRAHLRDVPAPRAPAVAVVAAAACIRSSGFGGSFRNRAFSACFPERLQAMERLLPPISFGASRTFPARVPAQGTQRRRVGLLLGCVQRVFFGDVNDATARVLAAEGCEVVIPQDQACCGALAEHAGEEQDAIGSARRLIDVFDKPTSIPS